MHQSQSQEENLEDLLEHDLSIRKLGEGAYDSPFNVPGEGDYFIPEDEGVYAIVDRTLIGRLEREGKQVPYFEKGGPRSKLLHEPGETVSAVMTCGGLCPGLNSVIRGIVVMNYYRYGNKRTYGIRYGYAGLNKDLGYEVQLLTPDVIEGIHNTGGTILGSSRGAQPAEKMVDRLVELKINVLYTIGGDGTQRGAMELIEEIDRRGLRISVVGIPKTIDNDIGFIDKSFGMETAFTEACNSLYAAHTEATASINGIGIVKVMGRESGFIAANATLATNEVNFCLIPELDFDLEGPNGFLEQLERRLRRRGHALVVVAEGAGQRYVADPAKVRKDASGNVKLGDIGLFLKERIGEHLAEKQVPNSIKYIDPSYTIRSRAPTPNDSIFCSQLAQMAVHAGMSGRTGLIVGYLNGQFIHIPMLLATLKRKKIDLVSQLWLSVLESTGQPFGMKNAT